MVWTKKNKPTGIRLNLQSKLSVIELFDIPQNSSALEESFFPPNWIVSEEYIWTPTTQNVQDRKIFQIWDVKERLTHMELW